jgi:hypothetical protein
MIGRMKESPALGERSARSLLICVRPLDVIANQRDHPAIKVFRRDGPEFQSRIPERSILAVGFPGNRCGLVVANMRNQGG